MASVLSSSVDDDDDDDDDDVAGIVDVVTRFLSASRSRPLDIGASKQRGRLLVGGEGRMWQWRMK